MVLDTVKIYLDGTMLRFESDDPEFFTRATPTGRVDIVFQGNGFIFTDVVQETVICSVKDFDDVLDAGGSPYGASQDAVFTALNAFSNFKTGGGGDLLGDFYKTSQYHLMTGQGGRISQSFGTPANSYYLRKIKVLDTVTVQGLAIEVITPILGNAVAGVYALDENGSPSNLLFQTNGEFDLGLSGVQEISLASNFELKAGAYAVGYIGSSAAVTRSISRPLPSWGQDKTLLSAENNWIQSTAPYSPTMASVFPTDIVSVSVTQATAVLFSLA